MPLFIDSCFVLPLSERKTMSTKYTLVQKQSVYKQWGLILKSKATRWLQLCLTRQGQRYEQEFVSAHLYCKRPNQQSHERTFPRTLFTARWPSPETGENKVNEAKKVSIKSDSGLQIIIFIGTIFLAWQTLLSISHQAEVGSLQTLNKPLCDIFRLRRRPQFLHRRKQTCWFLQL